MTLESTERLAEHSRAGSRKRPSGFAPTTSSPKRRSGSRRVRRARRGGGARARPARARLPGRGPARRSFFDGRDCSRSRIGAGLSGGSARDGRGVPRASFVLRGAGDRGPRRGDALLAARRGQAHPPGAGARDGPRPGRRAGRACCRPRRRSSSSTPTRSSTTTCPRWTTTTFGAAGRRATSPIGENVAILAGDGLFAEAYSLVLERQQGDPRRVARRASRALARRSASAAWSAASTSTSPARRSSMRTACGTCTSSRPGG